MLRFWKLYLKVNHSRLTLLVLTRNRMLILSTNGKERNGQFNSASMRVG
jgi:hypothetical protein